MGRFLAFSFVVTLGFVVAVAPVLAQTSDLPGGGRSPLQDYVFDDGTVVIEGDATTTCPSFAGFLEQGYFESGDDVPASARRVLERCVKAGLLDPEVAASATGDEDVGLPETGGPTPAILLCASVALLAAGGAVALRTARE